MGTNGYAYRYLQHRQLNWLCWGMQLWLYSRDTGSSTIHLPTLYRTCSSRPYHSSCSSAGSHDHKSNYEYVYALNLLII